VKRLILIAALVSACSSSAPVSPTPIIPATPVPTIGTPLPLATDSPTPTAKPTPAGSASGRQGRWYIVGQRAWPPTDTYVFWISFCPKPPTSYSDEGLASCSVPTEIDGVAKAEWFAFDLGAVWPHPRPAPQP